MGAIIMHGQCSSTDVRSGFAAMENRVGVMQVMKLRLVVEVVEMAGKRVEVECERRETEWKAQ